MINACAPVGLWCGPIPMGVLIAVLVLAGIGLTIHAARDERARIRDRQADLHEGARPAPPER